MRQTFVGPPNALNYETRGCSTAPRPQVLHILVGGRQNKKGGGDGSDSCKNKGGNQDSGGGGGTFVSLDGRSNRNQVLLVAGGGGGSDPHNCPPRAGQELGHGKGRNAAIIVTGGGNGAANDGSVRTPCTPFLCFFEWAERDHVCVDVSLHWQVPPLSTHWRQSHAAARAQHSTWVHVRRLMMGAWCRLDVCDHDFRVRLRCPRRIDMDTNRRVTTTSVGKAATLACRRRAAAACPAPGLTSPSRIHATGSFSRVLSSAAPSPSLACPTQAATTAHRT